MKVKVSKNTAEGSAIKKTRKYRGPVKGSEEAKALMAKVRAAQWAKQSNHSSSIEIEASTHVSNVAHSANPARVEEFGTAN